MIPSFSRGGLVTKVPMSLSYREDEGSGQRPSLVLIQGITVARYEENG
jgi:hypothetical protein